jgi:hypothetical protein
MLDHLDHMQVSTVLPFLPALLSHPDFQEGMRDGVQTFQEGMFWEDHEKAWTEDQIIAFVTEELSERKYQREQRIDQVMGESPLSYLHHLGFTISYLDQALAAQAQ